MPEHHRDAYEPLLVENPDRFVIFPIQHNDIWRFYLKAKASFWDVAELEVERDIVDWETKLSPPERDFIKNVLAFFAASDGIVNENLALRFHNEVQYPEARCFYGFQIMMENVHNETYSLLIDTFVTDAEEKARLFRGVNEIPRWRPRRSGRCGGSSKGAFRRGWWPCLRRGHLL